MEAFQGEGAGFVSQGDALPANQRDTIRFLHEPLIFPAQRQTAAAKLGRLTGNAFLQRAIRPPKAGNSLQIQRQARGGPAVTGSYQQRFTLPRRRVPPERPARWGQMEIEGAFVGRIEHGSNGNPESVGIGQSQSGSSLTAQSSGRIADMIAPELENWVKDDFELSGDPEGFQFTAGLSTSFFEESPLEVDVSLNLIQNERGELRPAAPSVTFNVQTPFFDKRLDSRTRAIGRAELEVTWRPNWRRMLRYISRWISAGARAGVAAGRAGAAVGRTGIAGLRSTLVRVGPRLIVGAGPVGAAAAAGIGLSLAAVWAASKELEHGRRVRELGIRGARYLYRFCISYTGALRNQGPWGGPDGEAGRNLALSHMEQLAEEQGGTVDEVRAAAQVLSARQIYREIFSEMKPVVHARIMQQLRTRRSGTMVEGILNAAQWGEARNLPHGFRRQGGAQGLR